MRWLAVLAVLALHASTVAPAAAQQALDEEAARSSIPHYDAMKQAVTRGRQIYLYDQAAWHATDRFLADWGDQPTDWLRGYFVEADEGGRLTTVFFGEQDGRLVEVARYRVDGSAVVGGGLHDAAARVDLSPLGLRKIEARRAAVDEAVRQDYGLCNRSQANTVILPPDDGGVISVYLMTAPTENDSYPIGGHYRIDIEADGKVASTRRFLNTCFTANYGAPREGGNAGNRPVMLTLSHLLDPQPTEIHVFASYYIPIGLMLVTTQNELAWSVERGRVGYVGKLDELRRRGD
jgi:hypothetical protein